MVRDVYITSNGLKIHLFILEHQKTSPAILFIHASGFYAQYYSDFLILLNQRGFNVIGIDLQGHGRSEGRRGDFTLKEVIQNIRDVTTYAIENYNSKVGIIGTSQGGIATLYALTNDARLKSGLCHCAAVLSERQADCIIPFRGRVIKRFLWWIGRFFYFLRVHLWVYIDRHTFFVKTDRLAELKKDPLFVSSYTVRSLRSLATASPPRKIEEIKTPIMFLHPENDGIFPVEYMRYLYDRLTCPKRFEVVPAQKHMFLVENPSICIDAVDKWFKETLA